MALTPEQIKIIKNHIPTAEKLCRLFIQCFENKVDEDEKRIEYLIAIIDTLEGDLAEVKDVLNTQL